MSNENLALWESVEKTPTTAQKPITGKQYSGNSPKPHYMIHKATETFGPCGIGWGFDIVDERVIDGAIYDDGTPERIHEARVRVWYIWKDKRGEVEHIGGTVFSGRRSNGRPFSDEDAPKKSVTDALTKALSLIGFAGDIFMGRYEDSKYIAELKREEGGATDAPKKDTPKDGGDQKETLIDAAQKDIIIGLIKKVGADTKKICDWLKIPNIDAMPAYRFARVKAELESRIKGEDPFKEKAA